MFLQQATEMFGPATVYILMAVGVVYLCLAFREATWLAGRGVIARIRRKKPKNGGAAKRIDKAASKSIRDKLYPFYSWGPETTISMERQTVIRLHLRLADIEDDIKAIRKILHAQQSESTENSEGTESVGAKQGS